MLGGGQIEDGKVAGLSACRPPPALRKISEREVGGSTFRLPQTQLVCYHLRTQCSSLQTKPGSPRMAFDSLPTKSICLEDRTCTEKSGSTLRGDALCGLNRR